MFTKQEAEHNIIRGVECAVICVQLKMVSVLVTMILLISQQVTVEILHAVMDAYVQASVRPAHLNSVTYELILNVCHVLAIRLHPAPIAVKMHLYLGVENETAPMTV